MSIHGMSNRWNISLCITRFDEKLTSEGSLSQEQLRYVIFVASHDGKRSSLWSQSADNDSLQSEFEISVALVSRLE